MPIKPVNKWLTCTASRLSSSVHEKKEEEESGNGERERESESEKLTHAHLHFKAFKAAVESWFKLSLILLLSRLSKFMAEEGAREGGGEREGASGFH